MIIETKYEIGQTVWLMSKNQVVQGFITKIEIKVNLNMGDPEGGNHQTWIDYTVRASGEEIVKRTEKLFATKVDLITSL